MVSFAIARNGRERRIKTFPYFNGEAQALLEKLEDRKIPAVVGWISDYEGCIIAHISTYWEHAA